MRQMTRRLATALAILFALVPAIASASGSEGDASGDGQARTASPIKHTIILYQENISFDHYFGTYGHGSNGIPEGSALTHTSTTGATFGPYTPTQLSGATQSRTCDVDHNYSDMIKMVNHGTMDQFLQFSNNKTVGPSATCPTFEATPAGPALANAYYTGSTAADPNAPLQSYWKLASQYTLADNFFQGVYGPSTPGAQWLVAATNNTTGDPNPIGDVCNDYTGTIVPQNIPNLGAEASAAGISWAWFQGGFGTCTPTAVNGYSAHHDPFQYFTSTADLTHTYAYDPNLSYSQANRHQRDLSVFDAALAGTPISRKVPTLPAISWVKAPQLQDGHPGYSGPALEDAFVGNLVARLKASPYWKDTALVIAFDETGGWWDHVAPRDLGGQFATWINGQPNTAGGCQYPAQYQGVKVVPTCGEAGLGPRMPVLVVSRFAKRHFVDHDLLNTASLTKWVEWNHGLPALGVWGNRDVMAGNLANAFVFEGDNQNQGNH